MERAILDRELGHLGRDGFLERAPSILRERRAKQALDAGGELDGMDWSADDVVDFLHERPYVAQAAVARKDEQERRSAVSPVVSKTHELGMEAVLRFVDHAQVEGELLEGALWKTQALVLRGEPIR
jgi:hypothetical protein